MNIPLNLYVFSSFLPKLMPPPPIFLAAAMSLKIGKNKRMVDLAQAAGVTEVNIRNRYNELRIKSNKNNNNINDRRMKPIFLPAISA